MDSQSHLKEIPFEILIQISSYLSTPDLGSLRRSCKHVESALFEPFSREFFTKKQFMLSEYSLQALIDISNHPRLSRCLSHVIVGLDTYNNARNSVFIADEVQSSRYQEVAADQFTLLSMGLDREMLTQAFRNLPNLQTVGLRDYHSRGRHRDNHRWASYGATTISQETGIGLIEHQSDDETTFASSVFSTIIYALGQAGARPENFEVLLRKRRSALRDFAFHIPNLAAPSVASVLSNLKTLLLVVDFSHEPNFLGYNGQEDKCPGRLLPQYLGRAQNLTHLRLNFNTGESDYAAKLLLWLGRPVTETESITSPSGRPLFRLPDPIPLSNLQRLDFGILQVAANVLFPVINKLKPTLRALSFWKVTLLPPDQPDDGPGTWAEFLAELSDLDFISLGCLWQMGPTARQAIKFKRPAGQTGEHPGYLGREHPAYGQTAEMSPGREYSGYDMEDFPHNVISDMVVVDS